VHVPSQKSEQFVCIYMLGVSILPLSDSVVFFFGTIPTVWYFLELFQQCGIFWNCSDSVVFLELFRQCGIFLELFRQCGIFGTVPTVWYIFNFSFYSYLKQSNNDVISKRGSFFSFSYLRIHTHKIRYLFQYLHLFFI